MPPQQPGTASTADKNTSVRARSKPSTAQDQPRKTVFRAVLDNPLTLQWPPLPASARKAILDELVALIEASTAEGGKSIADWRLDEHASRRGRTRGAGKGKGKATEQGGEAPKAEVDPPTASTSSIPSTHTLSTRFGSSHTIPDGATSSPSKTPSTPPPELLSHLVVGINEVTRSLESQIRWGRWELGDRSAAPSPSSSASLSAPEPPTKGRHRRRKSSAAAATNGPAVLPSTSARLAPSLGLAEHPAYAFAHRRPPPPTKEALPSYMVEGEGGVRMMVNSEGRRLRSEPVAKGAKGAQQPKNGANSSPSATLLPAAANQPSLPPAPSSLAASLPQPPPTTPPIDLLFVCKPDINPPSLVAHLPGMVAAVNGVGEALEAVLAGEGGQEKGEEDGKEGGGERMEVDGVEKREEAGGIGRKRPETKKVLLIPLDAGAEARLADALALRRVAAIGLLSSAPGAAALLSLLHSTPALQPRLRAPWLVPHLLHPLPPSKSSRTRGTAAASASSTLVPTTIKHIRTSAPLNPKAASMEKKRKRRERKDEEKEEKRKKRRLEEAEKEGVFVAED
ncbi:hypothetical protein JCM6882_000877 [Rhodosporidiobolus microsporus]